MALEFAYKRKFGAPTDIDAGIGNFRSNVVPFTQEHGNGAILLIDRESGDALAITLWEDEQAMQGTDRRALRGRSLRGLASTQPVRVTFPHAGASGSPLHFASHRFCRD